MVKLSEMHLKKWQILSKDGKSFKIIFLPTSIKSEIVDTSSLKASKRWFYLWKTIGINLLTISAWFQHVIQYCKL